MSDEIKVCDYFENEGVGQVWFKDHVEIHYGAGDEWFAISRRDARDLLFKLNKYFKEDK